MLLESGVHVTKLWFSVTQQEQRTRFAVRQIDPVRRWKLSPMDLESLDKWEAYTEAKEEMFLRTDTDHAPWYTVKSNDKKRARINALRLFLSLVDYDGQGHAGRARARREAGPARTRDRRRLNRCGRWRSRVARGGVEPPTFRFSVGRSYQLSYLAVVAPRFRGAREHLIGAFPARRNRRSLLARHT